MISIFVWLSTLFFGFLGMIWNRNDLVNVLLKFTMCILSIVGLIILYKENGFTGTPLK